MAQQLRLGKKKKISIIERVIKEWDHEFSLVDAMARYTARSYTDKLTEETRYSDINYLLQEYPVDKIVEFLGKNIRVELDDDKD